MLLALDCWRGPSLHLPDLPEAGLIFNSSRSIFFCIFLMNKWWTRNPFLNWNVRLRWIYPFNVIISRALQCLILKAHGRSANHCLHITFFEAQQNIPMSDLWLTKVPPLWHLENLHTGTSQKFNLPAQEKNAKLWKPLKIPPYCMRIYIYIIYIYLQK